MGEFGGGGGGGRYRLGGWIMWRVRKGILRYSTINKPGTRIRQCRLTRGKGQETAAIRKLRKGRSCKRYEMKQISDGPKFDSTRNSHTGIFVCEQINLTSLDGRGLRRLVSTGFPSQSYTWEKKSKTRATLPQTQVSQSSALT